LRKKFSWIVITLAKRAKARELDLARSLPPALSAEDMAKSFSQQEFCESRRLAPIAVALAGSSRIVAPTVEVMVLSL
jgi:hypothetical protein